MYYLANSSFSLTFSFFLGPQNISSHWSIYRYLLGSLSSALGPLHIGFSFNVDLSSLCSWSPPDVIHLEGCGLFSARTMSHEWNEISICHLAMRPLSVLSSPLGHHLRLKGRSDFPEVWRCRKVITFWKRKTYNCTLHLSSPILLWKSPSSWRERYLHKWTHLSYLPWSSGPHLSQLFLLISVLWNSTYLLGKPNFPHRLFLRFVLFSTQHYISSSLKQFLSERRGH